MNFDKLMNSKINTFADWIIRLVLLNILIVVCSLPVITLFPAFASGYAVLSDFVQKKDVKVFPAFFGYFRDRIGKKILFGVGVIAPIFYLSFSNSTYYSNMLAEQSDWIFRIGYFVTLALIAAAYAVTLYTVVVFKVAPQLSVGRIIKLSFFLSGKFYFTTMLLVIVNSLPFLLLLLPQTAVIFVFFGVSLPLLIHAVLSRQAVHYLEQLGEST